jgi:hypothetical protein
LYLQFIIAADGTIRGFVRCLRIGPRRRFLESIGCLQDLSGES